MLNIKIVNKSGNKLPQYETSGSAGMDLRAWIERGQVILKSLERMLVPTGLYIELPANCMAEIRPRSGLAIKHRITVVNAPGTIDSDYRGEIMVALINLSQDDFTIQNGDRIAQIIVIELMKVNLNEQNDLNAS